ncbi:MAG TPA: hypothetical protein VM871_11605, partial [Flavisolibacter sp.]|nr:hypothetical protein [Flavisolibacter sp.]
MALLRIGFVINNNAQVPAWYGQTIKTVVERGYVVFFVLGKEEAEKEKKSLAFTLFQSFENWWFRTAYDSMALVSVDAFFSGDNTLNLGQVSLVAPPALKKIKDWGLDMLYTISGNPKEWEALAKTATYGLWRIQFSDSGYGENKFSAFWEVMNHLPLTSSALLVYKNEKTIVAYEGTTATVPYSVKNNFHSLAWKASSYLPLRLATLAQERNLFLANRPTAQPQHKQLRPGNRQMMFLFLQNLIRYVSYKQKNKAHKPFTLLYCFAKFNLGALQANAFIPLRLPGKNVFYADPFVVEKDGVNYLFFEEMDYTNNKAHIVVITIDEAKIFSESKVVLERPYHLSYPFLFAHNGDYYMIPETAANKTVELYKATAFPFKWEHVM